MIKHLFLSLLIAVPLLAAEFAPPPEALPLEDVRMAEYYANPANRAVITGRFLNIPDNLRGKVSVSCTSTPLSGSKSQTTRAIPVAEDGSFRIEFDDPVPLREVFLKINPGARFTLLLSKDLDFEITFVPEKKLPTVKMHGADEELNTIAHGFGNYEKAKQSELREIMRKAEESTGRDFEAALAKIVDAKRGLDALLRVYAYAPTKYGWILQNELDAEYWNAVLTMSFSSKHTLAGTQMWAEALAFRPYVLNTPAMAYYRYLGMYLNRTGTDAGRTTWTPEEIQSSIEKRLTTTRYASLEPVYRESRELLNKGKDATPADLEHYQKLMQQLKNSGLLTMGGAMAIEKKIQKYHGEIPDEKMDFTLMQSLPMAPDEALEAYDRIESQVGGRWPRLIIANARPQLTAQAAAVAGVLAKESTVTGGAFGVEAQTLPSGAKLYQLPEFSGQELLLRIKSVFAGKALVLDFWGPWCHPCMEDLPFSEKLHAAVKDSPVEFIYLGCRTDEKPWKEAIARLGLSGTHFLLTEKQNAELMDLFKNLGYPSYAFIDRKGIQRPGAIMRFKQTTPEQFRALIE